MLRVADVHTFVRKVDPLPQMNAFRLLSLAYKARQVLCYPVVRAMLYASRVGC